MNIIHFLTVTSLLAALAGCSSPIQREPGSITTSNKEWEDLKVLKQRKVELGAMSVHFQKKKNKLQLEQIQDEQKNIDTKITEIESHITAFENNLKQSIVNPVSDWRLEKENIELSKLDLYETEKNVELSISTYEAKDTRVHLTHKFFSSIGYKQMGDEEKPAMNFTVKCDAPIEVKYGVTVKKVVAGKSYKFSLGDKKISNDFRDIIFHKDLNTCEFKFVSSVDYKHKVYGFKVVNEAAKLSKLDSLMSTTEVCSLKKGTGEFFNTNEFASMTCPSKYDSIKILPEPEDSLHARAVALLGQDLPEDFIRNGNPYGELDFSKAPKLDAVLVSYLVFRADFYGTLIGRMLAYHADQGAIVRVLISDVIVLEKDKAMFEKLMAEHPNLKMSLYRFDTSEGGGAWISEFHRDNHVKMFLGYSKSNPWESFAVVGGRNIHDGFAFKKPMDVSKYPEIVGYGDKGDESWAYWRDFEMVVRGQEYVESAARSYLNFYHINKENLLMKVSSVAVQKENAVESSEESMRHYISIPFKDEPNLNLFYARMIDTAKKKILISSPYFRPVKEIGEALDRAVQRGVDVTIITRLDLKGDTADFILGAVNKEGVNRFLDKVKVFEYIEPSVILHAKLVMVDDEFSFISSVNLNKRSFYHDLENGTVVNDSKFTIQMGELYSEYLKLSKRLTEQQKVVFWKKWIIKIADKAL